MPEPPPVPMMNPALATLKRTEPVDCASAAVGSAASSIAPAAAAIIPRFVI